jgi:hypothetical protein
MQLQPWAPNGNTVSSNPATNSAMPSTLAQQDPLAQKDPLAQLRDIHVPSDVNAWPLDWGWWCLIAIVIATTFLTVRAIYRHIQHTKAKKHALQVLKTISIKDEDWPQSLNTLLKRVALSYFPQSDVASLHGNAWFTFLTNQCSANELVHKGFNALQLNLYKRRVNNDAFADCFYATEYWISKTSFPKDNIQNSKLGHGLSLHKNSNSNINSISNKDVSSEVHSA